MIGLALPLIVLGLLVWGVVAAVRRSRHRSGTTGTGPPGEFRRAAELILLAILGTVATFGVAGLLTRLFDSLAGRALDQDVAGTARALAFTFIGGPLAALGWWWHWRRAAHLRRDSPVWALFLAAMSTISLMVWSIVGLGALSRWVSTGIDRAGLATAIVWFLAWNAYRWVQRHADRRPTVLVDLSAVLGSAVSLGLSTVGAIAALGALANHGLESRADVFAAGGNGWWRGALGWTVLAAGGVGLWWLHWIHDRAREARSIPADAVVVATGVVAGAAVCLTGAGVAAYDVLRWAAGHPDHLGTVQPRLGSAVAMALVGGIVWAYHRHQLIVRPELVGRAADLILSGMGLAATATGVGILVNALIGAIGSTLSGPGLRDLWCAGLSCLLAGGPLWVAAWRPGSHISDPEQRHWAGRRVYLVLVFSASALTAFVTLLVVGYQVFDQLLRENPTVGLVERIRTPLGLLAATALVAAYHFPVWRRDRAIHEQRPTPRVQRIVLVTTAESAEELRHRLEEQTGAKVTVWPRADQSGDGASAERVCQAVAAATGERLLVVTGSDGGVEIVPLER